MSQERLMKVLLEPVVSEKSARLADRTRQFVFKVMPDASKPEVRQAVELMFEVKVASVQLANVKGKVKRFGARLGRRANWKKAYVTLQEGHDINFMGAE
jgi:large subunit ribosomal protein L23